MQQGIFTPMFDETTLREAEEMALAEEQAREEGESGQTLTPSLRKRELLAEAEERRLARERRRDMLLVERVVDELPETVEYLKTRAVERARKAGQNIFIRGGTVAILGAEQLAVRWVAKVAEEVYRKRMDRKEAMSRLGRKREPKGSDPFANPGVRNPAFDPETHATPEEEAANDLFDHLASKVHALFDRPRVWVARRLFKAAEDESPVPDGEPPDWFRTGP